MARERTNRLQEELADGLAWEFESVGVPAFQSPDGTVTLDCVRRGGVPACRVLVDAEGREVTRYDYQGVTR